MIDESSLMLFSVKGFVFAIEVRDLLEVAEISAEKVSICEEGLFSYKYDFRGTEISVVDLARRISGATTSLTGLLQLIVVDIGSQPVGLMIDKVLGVVKGGGISYRFPEMLRTGENGYIKSIYRLENVIYLVLEAASVLKDSDMAGLRSS